MFIAAVAALGVAVRGWHEFHRAGPEALAGNRTALARQIQAVDSAIAVTSSKRKPHDPRARVEPKVPDGPPADLPRPAVRQLRSRARQTASPDTLPRDPRQGYWDRSLHFDSLRMSLDSSGSHMPRGKLRDSKATPSAARERLSTVGGPPVDLDIADLDDLSAIVMIGPALARRIYSDRVENGPFGSIAELERVQGITHAFARRLEPFVTFSGSPRHGSAVERRPQSKKERRPWGGLRP
jgi:hypothetical protein